MEEKLARIRAEVERCKAQGRRKRYPGTVRSFAIEFGRRRVAAGKSIKSVADELGISDATLCKWLRSKRSGFRPVKLKKAAAEREQRTVSLVTPSGYRLEGLDLESAARLLRRLG